MALALCVSGCWGSNGNGHDKAEQTEVRSTGFTTPDLIQSPSDTEVKGGDGNWYCFHVSKDNLEAKQGREACLRTLTVCEEARVLARERFGYSATECKPYAQAVCFPVLFTETNQKIERCFITGKECERVFRELQPGPVTGCAIQTNDRPPSGPTL